MDKCVSTKLPRNYTSAFSVIVSCISEQIRWKDKAVSRCGVGKAEKMDEVAGQNCPAVESSEKMR